MLTDSLAQICFRIKWHKKGHSNTVAYVYLRHYLEEMKKKKGNIIVVQKISYRDSYVMNIWDFLSN